MSKPCSGVCAISAGGDKSATAMGIMEGIFNKAPERLERDIWCGISAGALLSSQMSQLESGTTTECVSVLENLMSMRVDFVEPWSHTSSLLGFVYGALWHNSMFKPNLRKVVEPLWKDTQYKKLVVGASNMTSGSYEFFENPPIDMVIASASVPVVFPQVVFEGNSYCDGALHHVIPIKEIKKYWNAGNLDIILCYPTDHAEFTKSNVPETRHKLSGYVYKTLSEAIWNNMMNDLQELARYYSLDFDKVKNGGRFKYEDREIRIYVPQKGMYLDFTKRNHQALHTMYNHGVEIASKVLCSDPV